MILTVGMAEPLWTDDDIATLKAAIVGGVLTVIYAGPPQRQVTYQSLSQMRALLAEMRSEVNASPRFTRVSHSKGFDPSRGGFGSEGGPCG